MPEQSSHFLRFALCCSVSMATGLVSCSEKPAPAASNSSGPLKIQSVEIRKIGDHLLLSTTVSLTNDTKEPVSLSAPVVHLVSGNTEVPVYVVPFAERAVISAGGTGEGTLQFWLDLAMVNQPLELKWNAVSAVVKEAGAVQLEKLPDGESRRVMPGKWVL